MRSQIIRLLLLLGLVMPLAACGLGGEEAEEAPENIEQEEEDDDDD